MGCRLVTPTADATAQWKTEPNHLIERVPIEEEDSRTNSNEPNAESITAESTQKAEAGTNSTLSAAPRTVTSQLSDIVDMCEEMEEEEVRAKAEAVLERLLRAQYQLERLGDAASSETADRVGDIDTRFQYFLTEYTSKKNDASMSTACDGLKTFERELDVVTAQLDRS